MLLGNRVFVLELSEHYRPNPLIENQSTNSKQPANINLIKQTPGPGTSKTIKQCSNLFAEPENCVSLVMSGSGKNAMDTIDRRITLCNKL